MVLFEGDAPCHELKALDDLQALEEMIRRLEVVAIAPDVMTRLAVL